MAEKKELLFSVTLADCDVDTFTAGGPGGQHQNRSNTAVRIRHRASGATGESREFRSQLQNKKAAFRRMAASGAFRAWVNVQVLGKRLPPEEQVMKDMDPSNLLILGREKCQGCGHADCGQQCCIHDEGAGGEGHLRWRIID